MNLAVWIVWSRNDRMRKRRLLKIGQTKLERERAARLREWQARTQKACADWVEAVGKVRRYD